MEAVPQTECKPSSPLNGFREHEADTAPPQRLIAERLTGTDKPTVWSEFGQLAAETGAVNLGQVEYAGMISHNAFSACRCDCRRVLLSGIS